MMKDRYQMFQSAQRNQASVRLDMELLIMVMDFTFADGSKVNDIVVNKSGKIISGQYKELPSSLGWYTDPDCKNKIELDSNGLPVNGVNSDMDLYAKPKTYI